MFRSIFNAENSFWQWFSRFCDIFGLSLCWLFCSIPIITIGASTTALYDAIYHGVRKKEKKDYVRFFRTFKNNFKTATLATLPFFAIAVFIYLSWYVAYGMAASGSVIAFAWLYICRIFLCLPLAMWLLAMFTLSRFEFKVGGLLKTAAQLVMGHLPSAVAIGVLVSVMATFTYQYFLFLPFIVTPGLSAWLCSYLVERIFAHYYEPDEEDKIAEE